MTIRHAIELSAEKCQNRYCKTSSYFVKTTYGIFSTNSKVQKLRQEIKFLFLPEMFFEVWPAKLEKHIKFKIKQDFRI